MLISDADDTLEKTAWLAVMGRAGQRPKFNNKQFEMRQ
jgi:hypothetical protein